MVFLSISPQATWWPWSWSLQSVLLWSPAQALQWLKRMILAFPIWPSPSSSRWWKRVKSLQKLLNIPWAKTLMVPRAVQSRSTLNLKGVICQLHLSKLPRLFGLIASLGTDCGSNRLVSSDLHCDSKDHRSLAFNPSESVGCKLTALNSYSRQQPAHADFIVGFSWSTRRWSPYAWPDRTTKKPVKFSSAALIFIFGCIPIAPLWVTQCHWTVDTTIATASRWMCWAIGAAHKSAERGR